MPRLTDAQRAYRRERLPQWAQREIGLLEREVESLQRVLTARSAAAPETNTYLGDYAHGDQPLPKDARVSFHFTEHVAPNGHAWYEGLEARLVDRGRGLALEISSNHGGLAIEPIVTNVISIRPVAR